MPATVVKDVAVKFPPTEAAAVIPRNSTAGTLTAPETVNAPASRTVSFAEPVAVTLVMLRAAAALVPESRVRSKPAMLTAARLITLVAALPESMVDDAARVKFPRSIWVLVVSSVPASVMPDWLTAPSPPAKVRLSVALLPSASAAVLNRSVSLTTTNSELRISTL